MLQLNGVSSRNSVSVRVLGNIFCLARSITNTSIRRNDRFVLRSYSAYPNTKRLILRLSQPSSLSRPSAEADANGLTWLGETGRSDEIKNKHGAKYVRGGGWRGKP